MEGSGEPWRSRARANVTCGRNGAASSVPVDGANDVRQLGQPTVGVLDPVPQHARAAASGKGADATGGDREALSRPARSRRDVVNDARHRIGRSRAQERQRDVPALGIGPAPVGFERSIAAQLRPPRRRNSARRSSGSGTATKQRQGRGAAAASVTRWPAAGAHPPAAPALPASGSAARPRGRSLSVNRSRRSISTGAMPTAIAPCTSASRWSPTWIASSGRTPASARACSKMPRCGFS